MRVTLEATAGEVGLDGFVLSPKFHSHLLILIQRNQMRLKENTTEHKRTRAKPTPAPVCSALESVKSKLT